MAKRRGKTSGNAERSAGATALADADPAGASAASNERKDARDVEPQRALAGGGSAPPAQRGFGGGGEGRGFFNIYKPGQGYYTRLWSGVAAGTMVCWFAAFLYDKLGVVGGDPTTTQIIQVGAAVATVLGFGVLFYWLLALNRSIGDFLIATEGEMKKVNWTSRQEILGSTRVVVFVVIVLSILLFIVDIFFMLFFNSIGVLKVGGLLESLTGIF
jgi:preprotein translocase subunit SecE